MQISQLLAEEIITGTYKPGDLLPSEAQVMEEYDVSRPTARSAMSALRAMGLVESRQGKGVIVLGRQTATSVLDQTITRHGSGYSAYDEYEQAEDPDVTRTHLTSDEAKLLGRPEEEAAFRTDQLLTVSGTRAHLRIVVPFATADQYRDLSENPARPPAEIYAILTDDGQSLTWHETISARPALPDDQATLAAGISWLLVRHRVTISATGQPLILETLTTAADQAMLTYRTSAQHPAEAASV
jgi:GntR family transcriptional regulator